MLSSKNFGRLIKKLKLLTNNRTFCFYNNLFSLLEFKSRIESTYPKFWKRANFVKRDGSGFLNEIARKETNQNYLNPRFKSVLSNFEKVEEPKKEWSSAKLWCWWFVLPLTYVFLALTVPLGCVSSLESTDLFKEFFRQ
jgi:hypothetical protein